MKRIVTVSSALLILISCASPPVSGPDLTPEPTKTMMSNIPEWFLTNPSEEGYRFQSSTATSQDMQASINKASLDAQTSLAATIESEMEGYIKRVQEETGIGAESNFMDRYSQTQGQVIATALNDYEVAKKKIIDESSGADPLFRAYVLIKWDEGAANKRLLDQIKADKEIYDALRESELVEEMENKVEAYRKRMNKD